MAKSSIGHYSHAKLIKLIDNRSSEGITLPGPAGSSRELQYNNNGSFGGISAITWDGSDLQLADDTKLMFGTFDEAYIEYNENGDNFLVISGSSNGIVLSGSTVQIRGTLEGASPLKIAGGIQIVPSSNGGETSAMSFGDDIKLYFGDDDDSYIQFNDGVGEYLEISGSHNGIILSGSSVYVDNYLGIGVPPASITHAITLPESDTNSGKIKATAYTTYSSIRYKENVESIDNPLEILKNINGVVFNWKKTKTKDVGFIAEHVGRHLPEIVEWDESGLYAESMDYGKMVPILVEAIKNQQSQIDKLEGQIFSLIDILKDN
tara:strand:- start:397 stop:1356 length:960 start_codon:yes stop_codon:yes gene_type:complete